MKKSLYSLTVASSIFMLLINIFINSSSLSSVIEFSINLFIKNIFPSLFPMFILSSLLIAIDMPKVLGNIFSPFINKVFKTKGEAGFVFFMSMISGFPSSAKYIDDLIENKSISALDGKKILLFTFFSNPLFIVNTVGNSFFYSTYFGIIFLVCHILGNIMIGVLFRNYNKNVYVLDNSFKGSNLKYLNDRINECNIFKTIFSSIRKSIDVLLNVFGIVTFFLIIINIIFKDTSSLFNIFLIGLTEMTTGLKYLSMTNADVYLKLVMSMFFISFGGFSVHFQIMSMLEKRKVTYLPFLISRILHAIFSCLFLIIFIEVGMLF